jgi:hypothetical protein
MCAPQMTSKYPSAEILAFVIEFAGKFCKVTIAA